MGIIAHLIVLGVVSFSNSTGGLSVITRYKYPAWKDGLVLFSSFSSNVFSRYGAPIDFRASPSRVTFDDAISPGAVLLNVPRKTPCSRVIRFMTRRVSH